jgi:hypothetical protein
MNVATLDVGVSGLIQTRRRSVATNGKTLWRKSQYRWHMNDRETMKKPQSSTFAMKQTCIKLSG